MDRRVRKSKRAIEEALIRLMAENNFQKITINSIAEKADVNRGTFYLHYQDKYDLLDQCIENQIQKLLISCMVEGSGNFPSKEPLLRTFKYLEEHAFLYQTLLNNKGIPTFREKLLIIIQAGLRDHLYIQGINKNMNEEILIQFWSSAIIGVIEWWIIESMPYPAEEITEQVWTLLERNQIIPK